MPQATKKQAAKKDDVHPIIIQFRSDYAKALALVCVSKEHTDTEGWRKLYAEHVEEVVRQRRRLANELHELADMMECNDLDEDGEKAIGEIKKAATGLREAEHHWRMQTIVPVKDPVDDCHALLQSVRERARNAQLDATLTNAGLVEKAHGEIARVQTVSWDAETGTISIHGERVDPDTGEVLSA